MLSHQLIMGKGTFVVRSQGAHGAAAERTSARLLPLVCAGATALAFLALHAAHADLGLGMHDESFYVVSVRDWAEYRHNFTFFGLMLAPLWAVAGHALPTYRLIAMAISYALGTALSLRVLRMYADGAIAREWHWAYAAMMGLAAVATIDSWYLTPGYNTVALWGGALVWLGVTLLPAPRWGRLITGSVLVSLGGVLAALARPTSGVVLGLLVAICLLVKRVKVSVLLAIVLGAVLLAGSLLLTLYDFSPRALAHDMTETLAQSQILDPKYTLANMVRIDSLGIGLKWAFIVALMFGATLAAHRLGRKPADTPLLPVATWFACAAIVGAVVLTDGLMLLQQVTGIWYFGNMVWLALLLAAIGGAIVRIVQQRDLGLDRGRVCELGLLAVLPALIAFGTNTNLWKRAAGAGMLWAVTAVALSLALAPTVGSKRLLAALSTVVICGVATLTYYRTLLVPHLQDPLAGSESAIAEVSHPSDPYALRLPTDTAQFLTRFAEEARAAGLQPRTPTLDLSGRLPGLVYWIGAFAPYSPWNVGGLPGSTDVVRRRLRDTDCATLARSWLLVEPDSEAAISLSALEATGLRLARDYELAVSVDARDRDTWLVPSLPARDGPSGTPIQLYRPRDPQSALRACEATRAIL